MSLLDERTLSEAGSYRADIVSAFSYRVCRDNSDSEKAKLLLQFALARKFVTSRKRLYGKTLLGWINREYDTPFWAGLAASELLIETDNIDASDPLIQYALAHLLKFYQDGSVLPTKVSAVLASIVNKKKV